MTPHQSATQLPAAAQRRMAESFCVGFGGIGLRLHKGAELINPITEVTEQSG